jgi:NodT family efflux transporter outer membrane factor (OMF) lipoprotein
MRLGLIAAGVLLSACSGAAPPEPMDPSEIAPEVTEQTPDRFYSDTTAVGPVDDGWLADFGDPYLEELVAEAMRNNFSLRSAAAQLSAAAAAARQADRRLEPVMTFALGGSETTGSSPLPTSGASLDVSWELDVWGRIAAGQAATLADFQTVAATYEYARQSLAAQTAKAYFLSTEAWIQLRVADTTAANFRRIQQLVQDRLDQGQASEQDLRLSRADAASAEDALRAAQGAYDDAKRSLELILGRYPAARIEVPVEFLAAPGPVPAGLPSELLQRRPDVVAAERSVAAAFARTDEAEAARLPRLALTTSVGTATDGFLEALNPANTVFSVGANLVAPILDQGGRELQVEIATAEQEAAVADYGQVGLKAFQEVESALQQDQLLAEREAFLQTAFEDNAEAVRLAGVQYEVGAIDMLSLLQIQTREFQSKSGLVRIQSTRLANRVNLHLALGGSFEEVDPQP